MNLFLFVTGLIFAIAAPFLMYSNFERYVVQRDGVNVPMKIEQIPYNCIGSNFPFYVTFSYNGKTYYKRTRGSFCEEHYTGQIMEMRMLERSRYILFPNESALIDLLAGGLLGVAGLMLIFVSYRKVPRLSRARA